MATWTQTELEAFFPDGTINKQTDNNVEPMTTKEWSEWILSQVGKQKSTEISE